MAFRPPHLTTWCKPIPSIYPRGERFSSSKQEARDRHPAPDRVCPDGGRREVGTWRKVPWGRRDAARRYAGFRNHRINPANQAHQEADIEEAPWFVDCLAPLDHRRVVGFNTPSQACVANECLVRKRACFAIDSWSFEKGKKVREYQVNSSRGEVIAHVMAPEAFNGEYNRSGLPYLGVAWLVSLLAMTTNVGQAMFRSAIRKEGKLSQVLWAMGRDPKHVSSLFFDRLSRHNHQAKWGAAGWRALDLFYNYHEKVKPNLRHNFEGWITAFWGERLENRQAIANRLKIAVELLVKALGAFTGEPEIRLMSIASGSAQAVVEAMKRRPDLNVKVLLIDFDESALTEAKKIVHAAGFDDRFSYVVDTTKVLEKAGDVFRPHIIEMMGFLDYRPQQKAISLIRRIRQQLPPGGVFLTCNIHPNPEKVFLDWVLLWPMIYRTDKELADVVVESGFAPDKVRLVYEPFRIHGIAVCTK